MSRGFGDDVASAIQALVGRVAVEARCAWVGPGNPASLPGGPSPEAVDARCAVFAPGEDLGTWAQVTPPPKSGQGPWVPTGQDVTVWDRLLSQYMTLTRYAQQITGLDRCYIYGPAFECVDGADRWVDESNVAAAEEAGRIATGEFTDLPAAGRRLMRMVPKASAVGQAEAERRESETATVAPVLEEAPVLEDEDVIEVVPVRVSDPLPLDVQSRPWWRSRLLWIAVASTGVALVLVIRRRQ